MVVGWACVCVMAGHGHYQDNLLFLRGNTRNDARTREMPIGLISKLGRGVGVGGGWAWDRVKFLLKKKFD